MSALDTRATTGFTGRSGFRTLWKTQQIKTKPKPRLKRSSAAARSNGADKPTPNDSWEVSARIRYIRELEGISQRELARRAGLTHGTIALIENNKISPSIGSLRKILDAMSLTLTEFFNLKVDADSTVIFTAEDLLEVGTGGVSMKQVGRNLRGRPLQILYERYPPGTETAAEPYSHDGEEGGVVVKGCIEVVVGNQRKRLGPGEAFLFPSRLPHRFFNPGPEECVIVSAMTPPV